MVRVDIIFREKEKEPAHIFVLIDINVWITFGSSMETRLHL